MNYAENKMSLSIPTFYDWFPKQYYNSESVSLKWTMHIQKSGTESATLHI